MLTDEQRTGLAGRIVDLVRWIAVRGIAAALAGVVILGVGGRLVMLASRLLHPDAIGRVTENGNRIGEFTVEGTIGLIIFGGLLSGLIAGVIWVMVKEWIPDNALLVGLGAVALGGLNLVEAGNRDFIILGDARVDLILLLGLIFLFGAALVPLDRWLDSRLPPAQSILSIVVYTVLVSFGAALALPTFGSFFDTEFCFCHEPPIWLGIFMTLTALSTLWWWVLLLRGVDEPPRYLRTAGSIALAFSVAAGAVYLGREVLAIV